MHFAFAHQCRVLVRGCSLGLVELYGDVTAEIQKLHLEECRGFVLWKAYFGICFENNSINIYNSDSILWSPMALFYKNKNHSCWSWSSCVVISWFLLLQKKTQQNKLMIWGVSSQRFSLNSKKMSLCCWLWWRWVTVSCSGCWDGWCFP